MADKTILIVDDTPANIAAALAILKDRKPNRSLQTNVEFYTALLLEAIPVPDPSVKPAINVPIGEPPSPIAPPSGCRFRTRCPRADQRCADEVPPLRAIGAGQFAACHHPLTEAT